MKLLVFNVALTLGLLQSIAPTTAETTGTQANAPTTAVTTGTQATFAAKLFSTIAEENLEKNVIISPASIQTALALAYIGAEGNTAKELRVGLHLGGKNISKEQVGQQFGNLTSKMRGSGNATVKMANRIYIGNGLETAPKFNDVAERYFASAAETVDFGDSANTAQKINNWTEKQTENKIQNVTSKEDLSSDTLAVLVNAIYFKATWKRTFDSRSTSKMYFHLNTTSKKPVNMMKQDNVFEFGVFPDLDAKALSLGYIDTNIRMLVLLPNKLDGLGQLEHQLKKVDLTKLLNTLRRNYGRVSLPKFKFEFNISLETTLKTLGMRDLFSEEKANFSSLLTTKSQFSVSKVLHKAFIAVYEAGTEAAASTANVVKEISPQRPNFEINVDHPFYFALLDDDTVYFAGHVVEI